MKQITGDIWDYHKRGHWIVITTNGTIHKNGVAVMGKGIAKQAALKYPKLPYYLGLAIKDVGNIGHIFPDYKIITLPTKHNWWEKSDITLIERGCKALSKMHARVKVNIYMVRPGCSNGKLKWEDVKPIIEQYLDDRFVIVERNLSC